MVFRAPAPAPRRAEAPRPVTAPVLVAPTRISVTIPAIDLKAPPTLTDVVTPAASEAIRASGISSAGSVRDEGAAGGSGKGLGSGSEGKAFDENQVDKAVEVSRKVDPRYPDALKSVGVQGNVVMRFIVGTDGRVEPGSIVAVSSPHKLFSDAVRSALLNTRYRPAEAGGQKVRQLVEQVFTFKLT
jgi:protein TonB